MTENWLPVPGWEGYYEVSDHGRVRSVERFVPGRPGVMLRVPQKILVGTMNTDSYATVALAKNNTRTAAKIHRLVLLAFDGPAPVGMEGCHNDGDPSNNHLDNLRWDTHRENAVDRVRHGRHHWSQGDECESGHLYTPDNIYMSPVDGRRRCRECRRAAKARQTASLRAQRVAA